MSKNSSASNKCAVFPMKNPGNQITVPLYISEQEFTLESPHQSSKNEHYFSMEQPLEELVCYNLSDIIQQPSPTKFITVDPQQISTRIATHVKQSADSCHSGIISNLRIDDSIQKQEISNKRKQTTGIEFVRVLDKAVLPRAWAVLPSILNRAGGVISPSRALQQFIKFGPVQGVLEDISTHKAGQIVKENSLLKKPTFMLKKEDGSLTHIDVSDVDKSNWIGLLRLGDQLSANVWLHQEQNELFAVTTRCIEPHTPLMLGYTSKYAKSLDIPDHQQPIIDLDDEMSRGRETHRCVECEFSTISLVELERHNIINHRDDRKVLRRRRFRCRHCGKFFANVFCLKRHVSLNCPKRNHKLSATDESAESIKDVTQSPATTNPNNSSISQNDIEDKLPSDESLQNYTNVLDFSINLFDTDRIANFDISGSSKSDNEFLSYGGKDENRLSNEFNITDELHNQPKEKTMKKNSTPKSSPTSICRHCRQHVHKSKTRQHLRLCPALRFDCSCGRVFRSKEKLGLHVFKFHTSDTAASPKKVQNKKKMQIKKCNLASESIGKLKEVTPMNPVTKEALDETMNLLKCEKCGREFKRRGMLVNHLWRSHGVAAGAASLPLLVRERRYPCPACPNLYRSACKRDAHVHNHHPGVKYNRGMCISGGTRRVQPAACWACSRQYATRSKLLQHVRRHHPEQAPPPAPNKVATSAKKSVPP